MRGFYLSERECNLKINRTKEKCNKVVKKYYPKEEYKGAFERYIDLTKEGKFPKGILLDAGCGKGSKKINYENICRIAIGIDLDKLSLNANKLLNYKIIGNLGELPIKSNVFDMILCQNVIEHLEKPDRAFKEFSRILSVNGTFIFITPNIYNYVTIISKLTPFFFHRYLNKLRGIKSDETFPTHYRANSRKRLDRIFKETNLYKEEMIMFQKWPSYLMFSTILFRFGILYERLINRFEFLGFLRGVIIARYRKKVN